MKTNKDDGAFVMAGEGGFQLGLSKREYFAAMALKGILDAGFEHDYCRMHANDFAKSSVIMADALITEINKEEK